MRRKVAAALVAALACALAGCGGGERTEVVSRAVAIKRLEAACLAGQRATQAQMRGARDRTDAVLAVRANLQTILDRVGDLEPSGSARRDFDAYKASVKARLEAADRIAEADRSDFARAVARERRLLDASYVRGREAIVALRAAHVCI